MDGTTIDEVKKYHRDTLILCVERANLEEQKIVEQRRTKEERLQKQKEDHRKAVEDGLRDLTFD